MDTSGMAKGTGLDAEVCGGRCGLLVSACLVSGKLPRCRRWRPCPQLWRRAPRHEPAAGNRAALAEPWTEWWPPPGALEPRK